MAPELTDVTIRNYCRDRNDVSRNEMIANDLVRAMDSDVPALLTGRSEHLQYFATKTPGVLARLRCEGRYGTRSNVVQPQRPGISPGRTNRGWILSRQEATYGEGCDDARLDLRYSWPC